MTTVRRTIVDAPCGSLRGVASETGTACFAGIPFAAPPIGDLRWLPPHPTEPWTGIREVTEFAPDPAQPAPATPAAGTAGSAIASGVAAATTGRTSNEDCLYLNVWTPSTDGARPVFVWIFGGGFEGGSAAPPLFPGDVLARDLDAVVISLNYRVGALGFLHLASVGGAATSTNLGIQDQATAVHWVHENIAAFGGDPKRITLAGQSAGAFSVGTLISLPAVRRIVKRALLASGNTGRVFSSDLAHQLAVATMEGLRVADLDELQTVSTGDVLEVQSAVVARDLGARNLPGAVAWGPVLDGTVLQLYPTEAVTSGAVATLDLLVGANRDEATMWRQLDADFRTPSSREELVDEIRRSGRRSADELADAYLGQTGSGDLAGARAAFLSDAIYRVPATELAAVHAAAGGRAWSYLFADAPFGEALGASHGLELLYLFEALDRFGVENERTTAVRRELIDSWRAFVHGDDPDWPQYAPSRATTRQFGGNDRLVTEPPTVIAELW